MIGRHADRLAALQVAQAVLTDVKGDKVMSNKRNPEPDPNQPTIYQIRLAGHLGQHWADWFEGLAVSLEENGETLLTGPVADQAALHGLLRKVRDLGIPLVAVSPLKPGQATASETDAALPSRSQKEETK